MSEFKTLNEMIEYLEQLDEDIYIKKTYDHDGHIEWHCSIDKPVEVGSPVPQATAYDLESAINGAIQEYEATLTPPAPIPDYSTMNTGVLAWFGDGMADLKTCRPGERMITGGKVYLGETLESILSQVIDDGWRIVHEVENPVSKAEFYCTKFIE